MDLYIHSTAPLKMKIIFYFTSSHIKSASKSILISNITTQQILLECMCLQCHIVTFNTGWVFIKGFQELS